MHVTLGEGAKFSELWPRHSYCLFSYTNVAEYPYSLNSLSWKFCLHEILHSLRCCHGLYNSSWPRCLSSLADLYNNCRVICEDHKWFFVALNSMKSMIKNMCLVRTFVLCLNIEKGKAAHRRERRERRLGREGREGMGQTTHHIRKAVPRESINPFLGVEPPDLLSCPQSNVNTAFRLKPCVLWTTRILFTHLYLPVLISTLQE